MWSSGDVIKALEAVRELVEEGRRIAREAADKYGDMRTQLSDVFGESAHPSVTAALDRVGRSGEQIGEYIEVVKGNVSSGCGYDAGGTWRKLPEFPPKPPRHTHASATGKDGETVSVVSGEKTPDGKAHDWRYVDGVNLARRLGLVPAKGKRLTVHWRDDNGTMRSRTDVGRPDHD